MRIAVITGASAGMGREFVRQLDAAETFDEIWLIARRKERLAELAASLRSPARAVALDLTDPSAKDCYAGMLRDADAEVALLANISGFGKFQPFSAVPAEDNLGMVDLNVRAVVWMTQQTLPYMAEGARIFQWASMAAYQPVPGIATYAASKAFVLSFSRALGQELRSRKIRVMAVCPYWTKTEFFDRAVSDSTVSYYCVMYRPEAIVKRALRDMRRGKDVSVYGTTARIQHVACKLLPHRLVMAVWRRQQHMK